MISKPKKYLFVLVAFSIFRLYLFSDICNSGCIFLCVVWHLNDVHILSMIVAFTIFTAC